MVGYWSRMKLSVSVERQFSNIGKLYLAKSEITHMMILLFSDQNAWELSPADSVHTFMYQQDCFSDDTLFHWLQVQLWSLKTNNPTFSGNFPDQMLNWFDGNACHYRQKQKKHYLELDMLTDRRRQRLPSSELNFFYPMIQCTDNEYWVLYDLSDGFELYHESPND